VQASPAPPSTTFQTWRPGSMPGGDRKPRTKPQRIVSHAASESLTPDGAHMRGARHVSSAISLKRIARCRQTPRRPIISPNYRIKSENNPALTQETGMRRSPAE
jgi:hypothetical protein